MKVGDFVIHPSYPRMLWEVRTVYEGGQLHGWLKIWPYDPVAKKAMGLVLTKDGVPVDYSEWLRSQPGDMDWNAWVEAHEGALAYEWHRPFSLPPQSVSTVHTSDPMSA